MSNPCTRCGNQRIASKSWNEKIVIYGREQTITHTEFVCTDPDCQEKVDGQLRAAAQKRADLETEKQNRLNQKAAARTAAQ